MNNTSYFVNVLPAGIFTGAIIGTGTTFTYNFLTNDYIGNKLDFLLSSAFSQSTLIIASAYVLYDGYTYLVERVNWGKGGVAQVKTSNGHIEIKGIKQRLEALPELLDLSFTDGHGNKIFDFLKTFKEKEAYAIYDNESNIIDFKKYLNKDNTETIKRSLGVPSDNYFRITQNKNSHNEVKVSWKDPLGGLYRFDKKLLKKGKILRGYRGDEGEEGYYYTNLHAFGHETFAGQTGSGKSVMIRLKLASFFYNIEDYQMIYMIDLKSGVELKKFDGLFGKVKVGKSIEDFCEFIDFAHAEMMERLEEMNFYGTTSSSRKQIKCLVDEIGFWQTFVNNMTKGAGKTDEEELIYRQYIKDVNKKISDLYTQSRATGIIFEAISQNATVEHFNPIIRESSVTTGVLKMTGWYDALITKEQMEELQLNPKTFSTGTMLLKDGTESPKMVNGEEVLDKDGKPIKNVGDQFAYIKMLYITIADLVDLCLEEDKSKMVSKMWGYLIMMNYTKEYENNERAVNEYKEINEYFNDKSVHKYIDSDLVNDYLNDINQFHTKIGKPLLPSNLFMGDYIEAEQNNNEEFMKVFNDFLSKYIQVKNNLEDETMNEIELFISTITQQANFYKNDIDKVNEISSKLNNVKTITFDSTDFKIDLKKKIEDNFNNDNKGELPSIVIKEVKNMYKQIDTLEEEDKEKFNREVDYLIDLTKKEKDFTPLFLDTELEEIENMKIKLNEMLKDFPEHKDEIEEHILLLNNVTSINLFRQDFNELVGKIYG